MDSKRPRSASPTTAVSPPFATLAGRACPPELPVSARREDLLEAIAADLDRMNVVRELESHPHAARIRWGLEELRVAQFAQGLARGGVSVKKLRRLLDQSERGATSALS